MRLIAAGMSGAPAVAVSGVDFALFVARYMNQIVHMWGYESMDDRWDRRKALQASEEWQAYAVQMRPLVDHIENKILIPGPFFKQA